MAEPVDKTAPAGVNIQGVSLLVVKREPEYIEYANSPVVKQEPADVGAVGLLDVKREPPDAEYYDSLDVMPELVEVEVKREPVDLDVGSYMKREPSDVEDVGDRDAASAARESADIEVEVTPLYNQHMWPEHQQNLVEDQPAGRFTSSNSGQLDLAEDGTKLQREFRKKQSAEERQKKKAAYMREYRARKRKRQSGVPHDDVTERIELAETDDLEQLKDTTANGEVRASTSATELTESDKKIQRQRAIRAEKKRNYRARKRAMASKTLEVAPFEIITVPVEWDGEHQEQLTQNSLGFQQMESHRLSNNTIKEENPDVMETYGVQFFCNVCRISFKVESAYERHLLTHTVEDNNDTCTKNFPQKIHVKKNSSDHTSKTSHCHSGTINILKKIKLKSHILTHPAERPYCCEVCNKNFSDKRAVKKHMVTHTERQHHCDLCNKNFSEKGSLKKHMLTHTGEKPHCCDVCNKNFTEKGNLKTHMLTHTGERPHDCIICSKSFARSGHLKRHMLSHTGVKPHSCNICNKYFSVEGTLKHHMLTHTGERPHVCNICNKNFSRPEHLKSHMSTHTGERPFTCDMCNRNFSEKYNLRHHILTHTGEKPHRCVICNRGFSRLGRLKSHLLSHMDMRTSLEH